MNLKNISFFNIIHSLVRNISFLYLLVSFFLILVIDKSLEYSKKSILDFSNLFLFIFVICILFIAVLMTRQEKNYKNIIFKIGILSIIVFIVQVLVSYYMYFVVGWDVHVLVTNATQLANGGELSQGYFSIYPNNLFLVIIFSWIMRIGKLLIPSNSYFFLIIVTNFIVNVSCFITIKVLKKLIENSKVILFIYILMIPFILLSPWITVPYSDAWGMIFPILLIYVYLEKDISYYLKIFLMICICLIGYFVKPTVIIVMIAIVIIEFLNLDLKIQWKKILKCLFCCLCAVGMSFGIKNIMISSTGFVQEKNLEMPLTHFMMMGLNPKSKGVYSRDDYNYSMSFLTKEERTEGNIKMIKERLSDYGVSGYMKLLICKNMSNYNDGTFSWEQEGGFHFPGSQPNTWTNQLLANFYYANGDYYQCYLVITQIIWMLVLVLSVLAYLCKRKECSVIILSIFGLSLFLLLFECRARYLFLYLPLFMVLAGVGLNCLNQKINCYLLNTK